MLHGFVPVNRFRVSVHALLSFLLFRKVPHVLPVHVTRFRPRSRVARPRYTLGVHAFTCCPVFVPVHVLPSFRRRSRVAQFSSPFTRWVFTLHVFVPVNRFRVSVHALPSFLLFRTVPQALAVHVTRFRPR